MALALGRWRPRHLLYGWAAYWAALVVVALGPGIRAAWRVTRPGEHGNISVSLDDGVLRAIVSSASAPLWTGSVPFGTLALWVAGPPLLLWLVWLVSRPWRDAPFHRTPSSAALGTAAPSTPAGGAPATGRALNPPAAEPVTPARSDRQGAREWRDGRV